MGKDKRTYKERVAKDPNYVAYHRDYRREWRKTHKEKRNSQLESQRRYRARHPRRCAIYQYIYKHPELYPLEPECIFCSRTKNLEHAHLDYEDNGENYVTACKACNKWMDIND